MRRVLRLVGEIVRRRLVGRPIRFPLIASNAENASIFGRRNHQSVSFSCSDKEPPKEWRINHHFKKIE